MVIAVPSSVAAVSLADVAGPALWHAASSTSHSPGRRASAPDLRRRPPLRQGRWEAHHLSSCEGRVVLRVGGGGTVCPAQVPRGADQTVRPLVGPGGDHPLGSRRHAPGWGTSDSRENKENVCLALLRLGTSLPRVKSGFPSSKRGVLLTTHLCGGLAPPGVPCSLGNQQETTERRDWRADGET